MRFGSIHRRDISLVEIFPGLLLNQYTADLGSKYSKLFFLFFWQGVTMIASPTHLLIDPLVGTYFESISELPWEV